MGSRYRFCADFSAKHENVSGSCTLISVHHPYGDIKFVVDCGLYQGEKDCEEKNLSPLDFNPKNVDFVIITHNHADHIGRVPVLCKNGFFGKVYTTNDTKIMLPLALNDNEKIQRLNSKKTCRKPLYTSKNIDTALQNITAYGFEETFEPHPDVKVTFFKNGHLIGAAIVLVQISCSGYEDINLLFTGDLKLENIFFDVPPLPKWVTELPLHIMCEATYGTIDSAQTNTPTFINNIAQWLKEGKRTILVPALSMGRFQEVNYYLKNAQGTVIDDDIQIWCDGNLAIKYNHLYQYQLGIYPEMKDFMPSNYSYVQQDLRDEIINSNQKKIIVTTSGMGNYGPAQEYIPKLVERKDVGIHFTCFLPPTTMGYQLMNSGNNVLIESILKTKVADVRATEEFSSHAKRDELLKFLLQFKNIRSLLINHGEVQSKVKFAEYCKQNLPNCKEVAILGMGYTLRVDTYKITKSIREK